MSAGFTQASNWAPVTCPSSIAAAFKVSPFLWACFAIWAALSYPMCGFNAVTSMSDSCKRASIRLVFA